jgi:hypothetical protein
MERENFTRLGARRGRRVREPRKKEETEIERGRNVDKWEERGNIEVAQHCSCCCSITLL